MVRCEPQAAHGYTALACGYLPSTASPLLAARNAGFQHAPDTPSNPPCDHAAAYKPALHAVPPNCPTRPTRPPRKPPTTAKIATPATPRANSLAFSHANPDASLLTHVKTHTFTNLLTIRLLFPLTLHRENYFT